MSEGVKRIAAERERQMKVIGWDAEHDDEHDAGELAMAAICYAAPRPIYVRDNNHRGRGVLFVDPWPGWWAKKWDKRPRAADGDLREPTSEERIRMLEKAGALIAAEIDRLLRAAPTPDTGSRDA